MVNPRHQSPLRSHRVHSRSPQREQLSQEFSPARRGGGSQQMLDRVEQNELILALKQIIYCERDAESAKIELALKPDFNILDAFRMIDFRNVGAFNQADLIEALQCNIGLQDFTQEDIYLFFKKVDRQ
jgi:hypothetical protein